MKLALLVHSSLTALGKQLQRKRPVSDNALSRSHGAHAEVSFKSIGLGNAPSLNYTATSAKALKPLRVLRVIERGNPSNGSERLVMSGRMADVCAELDRLVALEAIVH